MKQLDPNVQNNITVNNNNNNNLSVIRDVKMEQNLNYLRQVSDAYLLLIYEL